MDLWLFSLYYLFDPYTCGYSCIQEQLVTSFWHQLPRIVKKSFKSISLPSDPNINSNTFISFCLCLVFIFVLYLLIVSYLCVHLFRVVVICWCVELEVWISWTLIRNKNEQEQRALKDYFRPVVNDNYSGIRLQPINANNFELKQAPIYMVQQNQYGGLPHEDPNVHVATFLEITDTVKMNGVTEDVIGMCLFLFSLRDKARGWLQSLQQGSINYWEEMAQRFLSKIFPPSKTSQLRGGIAQFRHMHFELLYEV